MRNIRAAYQYFVKVAQNVGPVYLCKSAYTCFSLLFHHSSTASNHSVLLRCFQTQRVCTIVLRNTQARTEEVAPSVFNVTLQNPSGLATYVLQVVIAIYSTRMLVSQLVNLTIDHNLCMIIEQAVLLILCKYGI